MRAERGFGHLETDSQSAPPWWRCLGRRWLESWTLRQARSLVAETAVEGDRLTPLTVTPPRPLPSPQCPGPTYAAQPLRPRRAATRPPPPSQRHVFSLVTRAGRASGSALPASTIHLEHFEDVADEVVEVDWVVEEAPPRRQRVESAQLVLHLVEDGAVRCADVGPLAFLAGQRLSTSQRDHLHPIGLGCLVGFEEARLRAVEAG
eukprot:scaffold129219_cov66-Phaeocystis_antarctica.AAC.3